MGNEKIKKSRSVPGLQGDVRIKNKTSSLVMISVEYSGTSVDREKTQWLYRCNSLHGCTQSYAGKN